MTIPFHRHRPLKQAALGVGLSTIIALGGCAARGKRSATKFSATPAPSVEPPAFNAVFMPGIVVPAPGMALGPARHASGHRPAALPAERPFLPRSPPPANAHDRRLALKWYIRGRERFINRRYRRAVHDLGQARRADPSAFAVLVLLGRADLAIGQKSAGRNILRRAEALKPDNLKVHYLLGRYALFSGKLGSAIDQLRTALRLPMPAGSPLRPLLHFYLAAALAESGDTFAGARQYARVLHWAPLPIVAYRYNALIDALRRHLWQMRVAAAEGFFLTGHPRRALRYFKAAATTLNGSKFIAGRIAAIDAELGRFTGAGQAALKLIAETRGRRSAVALQIWCYRRLNKADRLRSDLRRETKRPGHRAAAWLALGRLSALTGHPGRALRPLLNSIYLNPRQGATVRRSVKLALRLKRRGAALAAIIFGMAARGRGERRALAREVNIVHAARFGTERAWLKACDRLNFRDFRGPGPSAARQSPRRFAFRKQWLAALLRERFGDFDRARVYFRRAKKLNAGRFGLYATYVDGLLASERFSRALAAIHDIPRQAVAAERRHGLLFHALLAQEKYREASVLAKSDYRLHRGPKTARRLAHVELLRGNLRRAQKLLGGRTAGAGAAWLRGASVRQPIWAIAPGRHDAALANWMFHRGASSACGGNAKRLAAAARAFEQGDPARAGALLETLALAHPARRSPALYLSKLFRERHQYRRAADILRTALALRPRSVVLAAALATTLADGGHRGAAARFFKRWQADMDTARAANADAAFIASRVGPDAAAKCFRQAISRHPRADILYANLARLYEAEGDYRRAVSITRHDISINGWRSGRLLILAEALKAQGHLNAALRWFGRARQIMPSNGMANADAALLMAEMRMNPATAGGLARRALANQPRRPGFLDALGWALFREGHPRRAWPLIHKAIQLDHGRDARALYHAGKVLYRLGRRKAALAYYRRAAAMLRAGRPETVAETRSGVQAVGRLSAGGLSPRRAILAARVDRGIARLNQPKKRRASPSAAVK